MKINLKQAFKDMSDYVDSFANFFLSAFIGVTILGAVAYQVTSGNIDVITALSDWVNTTSSTVSTQGTALVAVVGTIISLIIIVILMKLFGKGGKGKAM